jgi:hypothetical protein
MDIAGRDIVLASGGRLDRVTGAFGKGGANAAFFW